MDKILLETDCPFLTPPSPRRLRRPKATSSAEGRSPAKSGTKAGRNEPIFVKYIAEKIAVLKNISFEKIADIAFQNAKNLFKI